MRIRTLPPVEVLLPCEASRISGVSLTELERMLRLGEVDHDEIDGIARIPSTEIPRIREMRRKYRAQMRKQKAKRKTKR